MSIIKVGKNAELLQNAVVDNVTEWEAVDCI